MPKTRSPEDENTTPVILTEYQCVRCSFVYSKAFDFEPYLCYRCMRFIAKRTYVTMVTITPLSRTEQPEI